MALNPSKSSCLFCKFVHTKENLLYEDEQVYVFNDFRPKAPVHFLVIPKRHLRDSSHIISEGDLVLVEHMIKVAKEYVKSNFKQYKIKDDMQLHFHKPLFTMVKHLHLHVLVGPLTLGGKLFFCKCMSNDPKMFTRKHFY
uniref:HIT domain-containing protein n=1 Tax=Strombidium rassoulzadegani TaxID=1082188 RepID=A0A7S3CMC8_9SPIT